MTAAALVLSASLISIGGVAEASTLVPGNASPLNVAASSCLNNPTLKDLVASANDQANGLATVLLDCDAIRHINNQGHTINPNGADDNNIVMCFVNICREWIPIPEQCE